MTRKWRNWGRTEHSTPVTEVAPRTVEQIVRTVERARETGHEVKAIGASHSFTAIGATDGIRVGLGRLRGLVGADLGRKRITVWAGTHLWELPAMLEPLGLALENMGDIDRQTVAGAIQTGTHGTGLGFAGLAARVVAVTLVDGRGEVITVSEDEHPELLPGVALGLGALGILVTVTLQCVPRFLLRAEEAPLSLDAALSTYVERSRTRDHYEFFWFPHTRTTRTKTNTRLPASAEPDPLGTAARLLDEEVVNNQLFGALCGIERVFPALTPPINRAISAVSSRRTYIDVSHRVYITSRRVRFREMEYAVPLESVPEVLRELRGMIDRRGFRVSFPIEVRSAAADALTLSTAHGRETGYIAVHRYAGDPVDDYFREAEAIFSAFDGRPHWGKMHSRSADAFAVLLPGFEAFRAMRDRLDPDRVFQNGYLRRVLGE